LYIKNLSHVYIISKDIHKQEIRIQAYSFTHLIKHQKGGEQDIIDASPRNEAH
jgi:hypothetical protein